MNWKNTSDEKMSESQKESFFGHLSDLKIDNFLEAKEFIKTGSVESDKIFQLVDSKPYDVLVVGYSKPTNNYSGQTNIDLINTSGTYMDTIRFIIDGYSESMIKLILDDQSNNNSMKVDRIKEIIKDSDLPQEAKKHLGIFVGDKEFTD